MFCCWSDARNSLARRRKCNTQSQKEQNAVKNLLFAHIFLFDRLAKDRLARHLRVYLFIIYLPNTHSPERWKLNNVETCLINIHHS